MVALCPMCRSNLVRHPVNTPTVVSELGSGDNK
ncbi:hypothetical protein A2U01_0111689, partial [Trifolium medium]|nr:hypothetical protein [Trifolium medium]